MSEGAARHPLAVRKIASDPRDDRWFRIAAGRGVMLLAELRRRIGPDKFDMAMDAFGREHAGKAVNSDDFASAISAAGDINLKEFFNQWLDSPDPLPTLQLRAVATEHHDSDYTVTAQVRSQGGCAPANVEVTVETEDGETSNTFAFEGGTAKVQIKCDKKPTRIIVNKYGQTPCANGFNWSPMAYRRDLEHTLIIYGTRIESVANRIAAEKLQQGIIDQWEHAKVRILPDTSISDDDLRGHHLLLVGRPECSDLIAKLAGPLPVQFGRRWFAIRGETYAHLQSAIIAAGANPDDEAYSIVCIAGLSPGATLRAAQTLPQWSPAPLKVLPANGKPRDLVPPAPELVQELK